MNLFDFDSFEVKNIDDQVLNGIASIYSENSGAKIYVIGFSDNIGNEEYNRNLSVKRAKAVSVNLASKRVSNSDMTSEGYGPDNPQFSNDLPEGRFLNRTV